MISLGRRTNAPVMGRFTMNRFLSPPPFRYIYLYSFRFRYTHPLVSTPDPSLSRSSMRSHVVDIRTIYSHTYTHTTGYFERWLGMCAPPPHYRRHVRPITNNAKTTGNNRNLPDNLCVAACLYVLRTPWYMRPSPFVTDETSNNNNNNNNKIPP